MKKVVSRLLALAILAIGFFGLSIPLQAQVATCSNVSVSPNPLTTEGFTVTVPIDPVLYANAQNIDIRYINRSTFGGGNWDTGGFSTTQNNSVSRSFGGGSLGVGTLEPGNYQFMVRLNDQDFCMTQLYQVSLPAGQQPHCTSQFVSVPANAVLGAPTTISFDIQNGAQNFDLNTFYQVKINGQNFCQFSGSGGSVTGCRANMPYTFTTTSNTITVDDICSIPITVTEDGANVGPPGTPPHDAQAYSLCAQIPEASAKSTCESCAGKGGIWTAVGCIQTNPQSIILEVMRIALGLAGGVALVMILAGGFLFSTSQGDIKRTQDARSYITSAVIGLLFIIFSVTILQFIGVSILQIPGFGG